MSRALPVRTVLTVPRAHKARQDLTELMGPRGRKVYKVQQEQMALLGHKGRQDQRERTVRMALLVR